MYSPAAVARRRCTALRVDGLPCKGWALWGHDEQVCLVHAGLGHHGPQSQAALNSPRAAYEPCRCVAYNWPHRPGGGICRWPEPPTQRLTTPAGTHRYPRFRMRRQYPGW